MIFIMNYLFPKWKECKLLIQIILILFTMHQVFGTQSYSTNFKRPKVALGNNQARYDSQVEGIRQKYYINSTYNSQQIPEWMGNTQKHYHRVNMRNRSINQSNDSSFMNVQQKYIYQNAPKVQNKTANFEYVGRKKIRSHWEMKNHTYDLQWPKPQQTIKKPNFQVRRSFFMNPETTSIKNTKDFVFNLPKYGIKQSPLHRQKQTPIKIGHSSTIDSIYVK